LSSNEKNKNNSSYQISKVKTVENHLKRDVGPHREERKKKPKPSRSCIFFEEAYLPWEVIIQLDMWQNTYIGQSFTDNKYKKWRVVTLTGL